MTIKLTIPRAPKSPNQLRGHVKHEDRNDWIERIWLAFMQTPWGKRIPLFTLGTKPHKRLVKITLYSPYRKMAPSDNLSASMKPILDSLAGLLLIYDDSGKWCEATITQHKSTKKEMRTEITVEAEGAK